MSFSNTVKTEWLDDGRNMRLLEEVRYTDPQGVEWVAPAGAVINGASIPRVLWSMVGCPFVGKYRVATVLHDHHCQIRTRPWFDVHFMFLWAMLDSGVPEGQAHMMFVAVRDFGPRWDETGADIKLSPGWDDPYVELRA